MSGVRDFRLLYVIRTWKQILNFHALLRTECTYVLYRTLLNVPSLYICTGMYLPAAACRLSLAFWIHQSPSLMRSFVSDPTLMMCDGCAIQDLLKLICVNFIQSQWNSIEI